MGKPMKYLTHEVTGIIDAEVADEHRDERLRTILGKLDQMQFEEGYHTEPAKRAPRWRIALVALIVVVALIYLVF